MEHLASTRQTNVSAASDSASDSIFQDLHDPFAIPRKKMLPWWMKFFCYVFLLLGAFSVAGLFFSMFFFSLGGMRSGGTEVSLYGLRAINELSIMAIVIVSLYVFKAFVAYSLLAQKDWAVKAGMIDGGLGILLCFVTMLVLPFFGFDFRFGGELFFLIPYQARLWRMRPQWEENSFAMQRRLGLM